VFGVGVEYALHCLLYLIDPPAGAKLVVKDIAVFQGVSETYLSKVFARLKKAGLVRSTPGVKGGYELARPAHKITFLEVVEAVEGPISLFQCRNIRSHCILDQGGEAPGYITSGTCTIHGVMLEAETLLRRHLQEKTLGWLHEKVQSILPAERQAATRQWFQESLRA
jgi:Rrf2 family protein